jgi:hypothetical protein
MICAARYYRAGNYVIEIVSGGAPEIFAVQLPGGADMEWKPPPKALPTAAPTATVAPSVSASAAPTAAPTVVVSVAPIASVAPTTAAPGPRTSTLSPAWFAAGLGVTAVAGGLAIGFGLDTLAKHDAFLINRTDDGANAGRDAQLRTNISIGVTAAAALTTAVLGYLAFRSSGASQGTGRAASPGVHASQWPAAPWSPVLPRVDDARWAPTTSVAR